MHNPTSMDHLRIARPVTDLERSAAMYKRGLALQEIDRFIDHQGFDGVMLGKPDAGFHLEFTLCRTHAVVPAPTPEDLLVFYVPEKASWDSACSAMEQAGFVEVEPFNPYWAQMGRTFHDHDGYRVVIQQTAHTLTGLEAKA